MISRARFARIALAVPSGVAGPPRLARVAAIVALMAAPCLAGARAPQFARPFPADPREKHLTNLRQLTFGGSNAEAYFSADGRWLIFQSTRDGQGCDQIYRMRADGSSVHRISTGLGRTTCGYFFPGGRRVVYASTHLGGRECPPPPDRSRGYVWPLYAAYDLFTARPDGSGLARITDAPGYDAEATVSPDGTRVVFTSVRDGDLDLYMCAPDGTGVRRLTRSLGYDGGAFFSPDGSRIVYRAHHPETRAERIAYRTLLARHQFRPTWLELFVLDAGGRGEPVQVTRNRAANFCPFFFPSGRRIIFSSNHQAAEARRFDLWAVDVDGSNLERITFTGGFEGFPMFSPDGKTLVWGSNRASTGPRETNVFIADWVP
jgi:Tol biopolymer transport system component